MLFGLMITSTAAPAVKETKIGERILWVGDNTDNGSNFHCNTPPNQGRGNVSVNVLDKDGIIVKSGVYNLGELGEVFVFEYVGEIPTLGPRCWRLVGKAEDQTIDKKGVPTGNVNKVVNESYQCAYHSPGNPGCGSIEWYSFSNQSGVPDGKNIQLTHKRDLVDLEIVKYLDGKVASGMEGVFEFKLEIRATQGNLWSEVGIFTIDNNGVANAKILKDRSYRITEVNIGKGFIDLTNNPITFNTNGNIKNNKVSIRWDNERTFIQINKIWKDVDGNTVNKPVGLDAKFDIYKVKINRDKTVTNILVAEGVAAGVKTRVEPGRYWVEEQEIDGYEKQPGVEIFVHPHKGATYTFINEPTKTFKGFTDLFIPKYIKQGDNFIPWSEWEENGLLDDFAYIWFDIYKSDASGTKGNLINSIQLDWNVLAKDYGVYLEDLTVGEWYRVEERIDIDTAETDGYVYIERLKAFGINEPLPILFFQAEKESDETQMSFFDFQTQNPASGRVERTTNIISNKFDPALLLFSCTDDYDDYFVSKATSQGFNIDDTVEWYHSVYAGLAKIRDVWMNGMQVYNFTNFFATLGAINLDIDDTIYSPEFLWNRDDFMTQGFERTRFGDTVIYEKTFSLLENFVVDDEGDSEPVMFHITGDNAWLLFVNGQFVTKSYGFDKFWSANGGDPVALSAAELDRVIGDRSDSYIYTDGDADTWARVVSVDITDFLKLSAENTITVVGVNEMCDYEGGEYRDDGYLEARPGYNPGGFIFGCVINTYSDYYQLVNKLPEDFKFKGDLFIMADFELYKDIENYKSVNKETPIISEDQTKTLVSKSGLAWNNGHTVVKVNVSEASLDGERFQVADSSPYNRAVDAWYVVTITDGMLTVSMESNVTKANIGAYVWDQFPESFGNAPNHVGLSVTIPMPEEYNEFVYLYFHNEGGMEWKSGSTSTFERWDSCCGDTEICEECEFPLITANVYDADGNMVAENLVLEQGVMGWAIAKPLTKLQPGMYTVILYANGNKIDELKREVFELGSTEFDFSLKSLRCGCDVIIVEDDSHICTK